MRLVPGGNLVPPGHDGAAELADLGRTRWVLEVVAEPVDELDSQIGIVVSGDAVNEAST